MRGICRFWWYLTACPTGYFLLRIVSLRILMVIFDNRQGIRNMWIWGDIYIYFSMPSQLSHLILGQTWESSAVRISNGTNLQEFKRARGKKKKLSPRFNFAPNVKVITYHQEQASLKCRGMDGPHHVFSREHLFIFVLWLKFIQQHLQLHHSQAAVAIFIADFSGWGVAAWGLLQPFAVSRVARVRQFLRVFHFFG